MAELEELGKVIETDVLITGAGASGIFAAIKTNEFVDSVTLIDKGQIGSTS